MAFLLLNDVTKQQYKPENECNIFARPDNFKLKENQSFTHSLWLDLRKILFGIMETAESNQSYCNILIALSHILFC